MNKAKSTSSAGNRRYVSPDLEVVDIEMKYSCLVGSSRQATTEELEEEDFIM